MSNKVILIAVIILFAGFFLDKFAYEQEPVGKGQALSPSKVKRIRPASENVGVNPAEEIVKSENNSVEQKADVAEPALQPSNDVPTPAKTGYQLPTSSLYEPPKETPPDPSGKIIDQEFLNLKKEIETKIGDTRTSIFTSCKCLVSFEVMWESFTTTEGLRKAGFTVDNFNQAMRSYCADEGAAVACNIKAVRISFSNETNLNWSAGTANLTTNGITFRTFDDVVKMIEKP